MVELSAQFIGAIVGFVLSYVVEQTPLKDLWAKVEHKPAVVNAFGLLVAIALAGLHFAGAPIAGLEGEFGWSTVFFIVGQWVLFVTGSQGAYSMQQDKLPRKSA